MSQINPEHDALGPVGRQRRGGNPVFVVLVALYALALGLSIMLVVVGRTDAGVVGTLLVLTMGPVALLVANATGDKRQRLLLDRVEELNRTVKALADQSTL